MSESEINHQPSVGMSDDMVDAIEKQLGYGDSKAEWIREACRQRLEREKSDEEPGSQ